MHVLASALWAPEAPALAHQKHLAMASHSLWQIIKYQFNVPAAQPYRSASFYIFIILAPVALVWQLRAANRALDAFPALVVVPCMQAMMQVFAVPVGGIFFREFDQLSSTNAAVFASGFCCILLGCAVLVDTSVLLQVAATLGNGHHPSPEGGYSGKDTGTDTGSDTESIPSAVG
jgi:hypothetical protein